MLGGTTSNLPHSPQGLGQGVDHLLQLRGRGAVGGHQHNDVADRARQDPALGHGCADADAHAFLPWERFAGAPIPDEFDARD